jgi:hypothetical protein
MAQLVDQDHQVKNDDDLEEDEDEFKDVGNHAGRKASYSMAGTRPKSNASAVGSAGSGDFSMAEACARNRTWYGTSSTP